MRRVRVHTLVLQVRRHAEVSAARKCRTCGQPILLALVSRKAGGTSWMPLNLKPSMAGQIATTKDVHGVLHGRVLLGDQGAERGETRYQTHFVTCAMATEHRKRDQPETRDPETLLKIARKEHAEVARLAARHYAACTSRGCDQCKRLGAHVARTEKQIALLTPAVEAPQESLF